MLRYLKAVQEMKRIIEDNDLVIILTALTSEREHSFHFSVPFFSQHVMATTARYVCAYEKIAKPDWWNKSLTYALSNRRKQSYAF